MEITGNAPFMPIDSWICFGSVARRDASEPEAFSFRSKNGIGFVIIL